MRNGTRDARKCCSLNPGEFFTPSPLSFSLFSTADDVKAKRACTCMSCLVLSLLLLLLFLCFFVVPFFFILFLVSSGLQKWAWEIARREGNALARDSAAYGASSSLASYSNKNNNNMKIFINHKGKKANTKAEAKRNAHLWNTHVWNVWDMKRMLLTNKKAKQALEKG